MRDNTESSDRVRETVPVFLELMAPMMTLPFVALISKVEILSTRMSPLIF